MLRLLTVLAASTLLPLVACGPKARVIMLKDGNFNSGSPGWLEFEDIGNGEIHLYGKITGLTSGKHGIHVHEFGDLTSGCASVGAHFNPEKKNHGGPQAAERHVGDLGNIEANSNGESKVDIYDKVISFSGTNSIIGRGLVIHNGEDDLGLGGFNDSLTTGHAGTRFACGTISIANATIP
ncbi:unnamed protein product [Rhizoctonia solani]|uniref:Superoxide dismutase [Cu-Zn] n=1 Tax=Rhizoctonia solani TaxID=456999 RepID=A0A8H2W7J3_9AGAM|nr:unnamed protein product [Rhizoctonia solani]